MKVTKRSIARHALNNTVCERLLNAKTTRLEEAQAVAASLHDFPLTWTRTTQIRIYSLWKWSEPYSNCTSSRWVDKFIQFVFWIPNSFRPLNVYGREALSPLLPLKARHWVAHFFGYYDRIDLFFSHSKMRFITEKKLTSNQPDFHVINQEGHHQSAADANSSVDTHQQVDVPIRYIPAFDSGDRTVAAVVKQAPLVQVFLTVVFAAVVLDVFLLETGWKFCQHQNL